MDTEQVRELLRKASSGPYGSQRLFAEKNGISPTLFNGVLTDGRSISDKVARAVGYTKIGRDKFERVA